VRGLVWAGPGGLRAGGVTGYGSGRVTGGGGAAAVAHELRERQRL